MKGKSRYHSEGQPFLLRDKRNLNRQYSSDSSKTKHPPIVSTDYRVAYCQSTGQERAHNEDTLFTLNSFLGGLDASLGFGIYLVADGMGGHQSGELASNLAAQGVSQHLMDRVYDNYLFERKSISEADLKHWLNEAVAEAQKLILRRVPGGGTTLTVVLVLGENLFSAHVGDSRLYLIGLDGKMTLKTRDHSLVKRLIDLGEITESEAGHHPHRNVLYRALGQSDPFEPDIEAFSLQPGERMLICTDGLWGVLDHQEMMKVIKNGQDLDHMVRELVHAANDAGGPDNISVILVERLG
jgi:PPM family protein phosphatase